MKLTDVSVRKALPHPDHPIKLRDDGGLMLEISPAGTKTWRLRTRRAGKDTTATIGHYPKMSLADARRVRDLARGEITPEATPKPSFNAVAVEWHERNRPRWNPKHAACVMSSLVKEVFPSMGHLLIDAIKAPQIKDLLQAIEARGVGDHAHDIRQRIEGVFQFAEAAGYRDGNPAAAMRHILKPLPPATPRPAVSTVADARICFSAVEAIPAFPVTRLAHRFLALTAQRPGEVRHAEWSEFEGLDGEAPLWRIPAAHMKMKKEHLVPLAPQAVALLEALRPLTGGGALVFPSFRDICKPIAENSLGDILDRAGYHGRHVPHGWRSTFSTAMNGLRKADFAVIELMLAHVKKDKVAGAYDRQDHWPVRVEIARQWADLLLEGASPVSDIINLPKRSVGLGVAA